MTKKILACVLVLCMLCPALSAVAALYPAGFGSDGTVTVNGTVTIGSGFIFKGNEQINAAIIGGAVKNVRATLTFGDVVIEVNRKFDDASQCLIWYTTLVSQTGTLTQKMLQDAEADAELKAGLTCDNNGAVVTSIAATFKENFTKYLSYKLNGEFKTQIVLENHPITFTAASFDVDPAFTQGTFFISADKISNFLDDKWVGNYVPTTGNSIMYSSSVATTLDGPYTTFVAPETGVYDVLAFKRENNSQATGDWRKVRLIVADEKMEFHKGNVDSSAVQYYWVTEENGKTVSLTAGQKVVLRVPFDGHQNAYSGVYGFAFVPRTNGTAAVIPNRASPNTQAAVKSVSTTTAPISYTASVTANVAGKDVTVNAGAATKYYPNVALSDNYGNLIEQPTVLDALIAASEAGEIELPFELKAQTVKDGGLVSELTSDKVTAITYDTVSAAGNLWPTNSSYGAGYNSLWSNDQIMAGGAGTSYTMTVNAPEAGEYYIFGAGCAYKSGTRYVSFTVNGVDAQLTPGSNQFFYQNISANQCGEVPVQLNKGDNTVVIKFNGGVCRLSYAGFIKAENYEEAVSVMTQITASKTAFNEYYSTSGNFYVNGKISDCDDLVVTVNGVDYREGFDKIIIPEGAVITTAIVPIDKTNFKPMNLDGVIGAYGSTADTDRLVVAGNYVAGTDYTTKFTSDNKHADKFPVDMAVKGALEGCYFNGYITLKADCTGQTIGDVEAAETTGDDTLVKIYVQDWPITASTKGTDRMEFGFVLTRDVPGYSDKFVSADLNPEIEGNETYHAACYIQTGGLGNYDLSNLYLTNSMSAAPAKVTVTDKGNGVYNLTCNKTVPVCLVKVVKADGVVTTTSITNDMIEFVDADGIDVTVGENETLYVWKGTSLPLGNAMVPLCAPITR